MTLKDKAARTAATSLEAIETWARRTFYAAVTTAAVAVLVGSICVFGAWKYWQVTSAIASYGEHSRTVMNDPEVKASQARATAARAKLQATINGR